MNNTTPNLSDELNSGNLLKMLERQWESGYQLGREIRDEEAALNRYYSTADPGYHPQKVDFMAKYISQEIAGLAPLLA
jgi:hypothetical protein